MPASNPNLTPHFNTRVLMSDAQFMSNELAINPYMDTSEPFDVEKAVRQHRGIQEALASIGIEVVKIDAPAGCQDGVFTANEALLDVDDETLLMARLPKGREEETPYYEAALRKLGKKIIHLPNADWYFSGQGDALRYGPYLLAGQKFRTAPGPEVHDFIEANLGYTVIRLQTVGLYNNDGAPDINQVTGLPNSDFYDLDYAVAPIIWPAEGRRGLLAVCKEAWEAESLEKIQALPNTDFIWVPYEEATGVSACNLVSNGQSVVMNAGAPVLEQALRDHGLTVVTTSNDELKKNGGSVRCTTLTIHHAPKA
mgnify:FL=1